MFIGILKFFKLDVYDLLYIGATLSFVMSYVSMRFDVLSDVLVDVFLVSTLVGNSIVAERIYRKYPVTLFHRVTLADLLELHILYFDVILGMDWLHLYYAFIDELVPEWKRGNSMPNDHFVSCLAARKVISKGWIYYLVRVGDMDSKNPTLESVSIVNEFLEVFLDDLPGFFSR